MADWICADCGYWSDDPVDIREHDCEDEEVLLALGRLHCAICERWGTVPGSTRCQECNDEQEVSGRLFDGGLQSIPRFEMGRIVATPGALDSMERRGIEALELLARHVSGDWGDLDDEDRRENEFAVSRKLRVFSAYGAKDDPDRLWVITEADRSVTTILRPEEY